MFALQEFQEGDAPNAGQSSVAQASQAETESVWHECLDPSTQHVYYWNTVTNEVTWTPPEDYHAASTQGSSSAAASTAQESSTQGPSASVQSSGGNGEDMVMEEEEMLDDDSDCNIENYDDDDNGVDQPGEIGPRLHPSLQHSLPMKQAPSVATASKAEVTYSQPVSVAQSSSASAVGSPPGPNLGWDGDINIEQYDDEKDSPHSESGVSRERSRDDHYGASDSSRTEKAKAFVATPSSSSCAVSSGDQIGAEHGQQRSFHSSPASSPVSAAPSDAGEDSDSDCNISHYDADDTDIGGSMENPSKNNNHSEAGAGAKTQSIDRDLVPYDDQELANMLFADSATAEKYGYKHLVEGDSRRSPSHVVEKGESKLSAKSGSSLALKPRSVKRPDPKKSPVSRPDSDALAKSPMDSSADGKPLQMMDMFADEGTATAKASSVAESSSAASISGSQAVSQAGSPSPSNGSENMDDLADFDIDAALEQSLELAQGKLGKRPHEGAVSAGDDTPVVSAGSPSTSGLDNDEPAKKRLKAAEDISSKTDDGASADMSDMDLAAESDSEMKPASPLSPG